jgi:hypothetical protein
LGDGWLGLGRGMVEVMGFGDWGKGIGEIWS